jgi:hypothetical protein
MGKTLITDFYLYRWRYAIGYTTVILAFVLLLLFAGLYVPGGLNDREMQNLATTAGINFREPESLTIINAPYYLFQKLFLVTLGVTTFTIKLPSLVVAFATGIGAVLLLRRWFRPNIAVLASTIMVTTGQFLFVAQSGTASISYILWAVWLLLAATMITSSSRHKRFWKVLFFIIMPLSLYTPLSIYLVLAIISAALLHPHVRHVLKRMSPTHLAGLGLISAVLIAPLAYLIYLRPQLGLQLLGVPEQWPPNFLVNAQELVQQYLNFIAPQSGSLMTPVLGLGSIALIFIGAWQLYKTRYTARSYTMTAWGILLVPILFINPTYTTITFVPFLLLLASGLNFLLRSWYKMFPRNPYARIAGLVPLVVLVSGLVVSGVDRYVYGYHYDPQTATSFSRDLTLFNYKVKGEYFTQLVVTNKEKPFYDAVAKYNKGSKILVMTNVPAKGDFAATRDAHMSVKTGAVTRIVTTGYSNEGDRFYIYKNQ